MINMNRVAIQVAQYEGKKKQVDIGQIKEVMRIALTIIAHKTDYEISKLMGIYRKRVLK